MFTVVIQIFCQKGTLRTFQVFAFIFSLHYNMYKLKKKYGDETGMKAKIKLAS